MAGKSGDLNWLVAFERPNSVDTDGGIANGVWSEVFRRLVAIEEMPGAEPVIAQRLQGVNPVNIRVRSSTQTRTITAGWRIRDPLRSTYYNIRSVVPDMNREWIKLVCSVGDAVNG